MCIETHIDDCMTVDHFFQSLLSKMYFKFLLLKNTRLHFAVEADFKDCRQSKDLRIIEVSHLSDVVIHFLSM